MDAPNTSVVIVGLPNLITASNIWQLKTKYQNPLDATVRNTVSYFSMHADAKATKYLKAWYQEDVAKLKEYCELNNIKVIAVTNAKFWTFATKDKNFTANMEAGSALNGVGELDGYTIVPLMNYYTVNMQPHQLPLFNRTVETLNKVLLGTHKAPEFKLKDIDVNILHTVDDVRDVLEDLVHKDILTFDIEGTGLFLGKDSIITLAIADSTTRGYSIPLCDEYTSHNKEMRELVKDFFDNFNGKQVWHNASFDIPFILRDLYGLHPTDSREVNAKINSWDIVDTMIMKFLCVNGLNKPSLGLKDELLPIYGEYDKDVDQSRLLDYDYKTVGTYNIYDVTGTFELYEKYSKLLIEEEQDEIYENYYKQAQKDLLKMKFKGIRIEVDDVDKAIDELQSILDDQYTILNNNPYVQEVVEDINYNAMLKYNNSHVKQKSIVDFDLEFNASSPIQKRMLLVDVMGMEVIEKTKTGNPSLGGDVIEKYQTMTNDETKLEVLVALQEITSASKVLSSFLKNFKRGAVYCPPDNSYRIHSDYNLTGTVSGRLSSSSPAKINMQNLPSGSKSGAMIKKLFVPPEGYIFAGSDFANLEDRVIAEQSGDEIKRKIILEGYDSHSLYATIYVPDVLKERGLPYDTDTLTKEQSFEIKKKAKDIRDGHKSCTFALAYDGTEHTISKQLNIPLADAKVIVDNYHKAHYRIRNFQENVIRIGTELGYYVTDAGLKIRCKELQSPDEFVVSKFSRSLSNAATQGPAGMLTIKALMAFQKRIEDANLDNDVIIMNTIHDAIYMYIKDDPMTIKWANKHLIECMTADYTKNQEVPLAANLDVGYSWKDQRELPNNASIAEIESILKD